MRSQRGAIRTRIAPALRSAHAASRLGVHAPRFTLTPSGLVGTMRAMGIGRRRAALWALLVSGCSLARGALGAPRDAAVDVAVEDGAVLDAPSTDVGTDAPSACVEDAVRCSTDLSAVERCTAGAWQSSPCELGCLQSPARCAALQPSNVAASLASATGDVVLTEATTIDTDACAAVGSATGRVVPQDSTASDVCLLEVGQFSVASGVTVSVIGARPLVVVAHGALRVDGLLDASSYAGGRTGAGSGTGGTAGGAGVSAPSGGPGDAGGGGGGFGAAGGNGAGEGGAIVGGTGGASVASELVPLVGGAAGGAGSGTMGTGGRGGGALQLTSFVEVRIGGTVAAAGAGGGGGDVYFGGGGGGSGGGILIEAPTVTLHAGPSPSVTVAGGGGGSGGCASASSAGTRGTDGQAAGVGRAAGAAAPCAVTRAGGLGGGADVPAGDPATYGTSGSNGSGGGGGAGRIVVRSRDGTLPAGITNPSAPSVLVRSIVVH